ncbi:MAG: 2TM domain-containing protein, partial [Sphingobacteriales bacterium]
WPLWTTLGWGIGLISHYFSVYHGFNEKNLAEREYEKLKRTHGL